MTPLLSLLHIPFPKALYMVLDFHLQEGATILDPTCGNKYSWEDVFKKRNEHCFFPTKEMIITHHDIKQGGKFSQLPYKKEFDACFFDPPYIWGVMGSKDKRKTDYGEYNHTFEDIENMFISANTALPKYLKPRAKLFLKYADVFSLKERKFYLTQPLWVKALTNFVPIDHYIIQHHQVSGTAFQVKNRGCSVGNYTYLTVFQLKGK